LEKVQKLVLADQKFLTQSYEDKTQSSADSTLQDANMIMEEDSYESSDNSLYNEDSIETGVSSSGSLGGDMGVRARARVNVAVRVCGRYRKNSMTSLEGIFLFFFGWGRYFYRVC
jgi:hypothetical protein